MRSAASPFAKQILQCIFRFRYFLVCFTFYDHWNSMGRWEDGLMMGFFLLGSWAQAIEGLQRGGPSSIRSVFIEDMPVESQVVGALGDLYLQIWMVVMVVSKDFFQFSSLLGAWGRLRLLTHIFQVG